MPTINTFDSDKLNTIEIFRRLCVEADEFECYPNPHADRIAVIADQLARSFNLGGRDRFSLRAAALLHDLGEVAMARDYIQRPGSLTAEERIDLARHTIIGEREAARAGADRGAQLLVRWHHESWNGSGYPDGLRFEQIPLGARISLAFRILTLGPVTTWINTVDPLAMAIKHRPRGAGYGSATCSVVAFRSEGLRFGMDGPLYHVAIRVVRQ